MIATAHVIFDRSYFELQYDEWLYHRSRFKRYEIWFAIALLLFGLGMTITFPHQWLVGVLFASVGVYEVVMTATHKRRWVNARVATERDGKSVDLQFDSVFLTSTSANGSSKMQLSGFTDFTPASKGFFLIPASGMSIYIPRDSIAPSNAYCSLLDVLKFTISSAEK